MAFDYNDIAFTTPLTRAVFENNPTALQEALSRGFNANLPDNRGWTPLHEAATDDARVECLGIILSHPSACINSQTFQGETALFLACQNECLKAAKLLLNHCKCNVNLSTTEGVSPLHIACNKVNIKVIKLLIKHGANINSQDFNGYTPLHEIVTSVNGGGNRKDEISLIVSYLLSHQANPDLSEYEGNFPFHFACQNGILKCIILLLTASKYNNVVNCCNNDGRSPLMLAVSSKNIAVLEYLLSQGADPNVVDKSNVTPLHIAAHTANFEIFKMIYKVTTQECIKKYCTFNEERDFQQILQSKRINSLICLAIDTEDLQFLTSILECGINSEALECPVIHAENLVEKTFTLHSPISFLLESKMYDLAERTVDFLSILISHGSPLKMTSKIHSINYIDPICAALVALNDCHVHVVMNCLRFLLENGADPDYPYGRMPFAMEQACMRTCKEAVLLLLQFSNVLEPGDILEWIEQETSSNQEQIVEALLPLAPYYTPSNRLPLDVGDASQRMNLLTPKVYSLANYCRAVIRKQLHEELRNTPTLFKNKLLDLGLPKKLYNYVCYN